MQKFDVLDPEQEIQKSVLLEASAGTGKTFSIEHLVVRFILGGLEQGPVHLGELLIVTFTRKATSDLKRRIRSSIEAALDILQSGSSEGPGYLFQCDRARGIRRLQNALFSFDSHQVFTIHGFCGMVLRELSFNSDIAMHADISDAFPNESQILEVIYDFFRLELTPSLLSLEELSHVMRSVRHDPERLAKQLLKMINDEVDDSCVDLEDLQERFISLLKQMSAYELVEFAKQRLGAVNRSGEVKAELQRDIERLLLTKSISSLLYSDWALANHFGNRLKKGGKELPEEARGFFEKCRRAQSPTTTLSKIAARLKIVIEKHKHHHEWIFPDDLLKQMKKACQTQEISDVLRNRYRVCIIDEFQDTDPDQWEIFDSLFLHEAYSGTVYLVGDPKQSIYRFRGADVYTYLKAGERLGLQSRYSLSVNYRSCPQLVHALNGLFAKGVIELPKMGHTMSIPAVSVGSDLPGIEDGKGALSILVCESDKKLGERQLKSIENTCILSVVNEIVRLNCNHQVPFSDIAILVRHRFQAERVMEALIAQKVPATSRRSGSLLESKAYDALIVLLKTMAAVHNLSEVRKLLISPIFSGSDALILQFNEAYREADDLAVTVMQLLLSWRSTLNEKGVAALFRKVLASRSPFSNENILSGLLGREEGRQLYADFEQLIEHLAVHETQARPSVEGLIRYLENLSPDEALERRFDSDADAVQVLTLHASKGLEFDVVIPLGLMSRVRVEQGLEHAEVEEQDAEKLRLFYVGMTRAKRRVILPVPLGDPGPYKAGTTSCLEQYIRSAGFDVKRLYTDFLGWAKMLPETTISFVKDETRLHAKKKEGKLVERPTGLSIPLESTSIDSFSSLCSKQHYARQLGPLPENTMPRGARVGTILHQILALLPAKLIRDLDPIAVTEFCRPFLQRTELEDYLEDVVSLVLNTFSTPFSDHFCLGDVDFAKAFRERPFFYKSVRGYVQGVIDLVFEHEGLIYLLDWKSNWLPRYTDEDLRQVISEEQYDLQAEIYSEAVQRYLRLFPGSRFGGCYTLFLRGYKEGSGLVRIR